jgi:hypothetical protein
MVCLPSFPVRYVVRFQRIAFERILAKRTICIYEDAIDRKTRTIIRDRANMQLNSQMDFVDTQVTLYSIIPQEFKRKPQLRGKGDKNRKTPVQGRTTEARGNSLCASAPLWFRIGEL